LRKIITKLKTISLENLKSKTKKINRTLKKGKK